MLNKQITKFINLIAQYNDRSSQETKIISQGLRPSVGIDSAFFRQTVQAKIKEKYQETKNLKTCPLELDKIILQNEGAKQRKRKQKKKMILRTEESQRKSVPHPNERLSKSRMMSNQDSLERLINKKGSFFLNKSNLLVHQQVRAVKDRKPLNPQNKTEGLVRKMPNHRSNHFPKEQIDRKMRDTVANYGYGLDGSIYSFQQSTKKVHEEVLEEKLLQKANTPKKKEDIYRLLRNTSPLTIKRKMMKQRKSIQYSEGNSKKVSVRDSDMPSFKTSNLRLTEKHGIDNLKMVPKQFKQTNTFYIRARDEEITGWDYEEQA